MSIELTREEVTPGIVGGRHVWPLKVTAASTTAGLSSEIFVYHADAGGDLLNGDIFECVASVSQMDDIGLTADFISDPAVPYYRSTILEFNCRSEHELERLWDKILQDVQALHNNFKSWENVSSGITVEIS